MNIVYCCDEGFAGYAAVSITSLFENNKQAGSITVYVLANRISPETAGRFCGIGNRYGAGRSVIIISLEDFEGELKALLGGLPEAGRFTLTSLARIFAAGYLPDGVERFLYLDSDTMVRAPLSPLFDMDMEGRIAGMVPEPTIYPGIRDKLGIEAGAPYYNAGVLLVDRRAWEREDITERCLKYLAGSGRGPEFLDQDVINYILKGRIYTLPPYYDFFSNYYYRSYKSLVRLSPWYASAVSEADYLKAVSDPALVHFAGLERPWLKGNYNPYRAEYKRYLTLSPWAGTKELTGHERDMLLYHMMNLLTAACPRARDIISMQYYNKMIKR